MCKRSHISLHLIESAHSPPYTMRMVSAQRYIYVNAMKIYCGNNLLIRSKSLALWFSIVNYSMCFSLSPVEKKYICFAFNSREKGVFQLYILVKMYANATHKCIFVCKIAQKFSICPKYRSISILIVSHINALIYR